MGLYRDRRLAIKKLKELTKNPSEAFVIHYSHLTIHESDNLSPMVSAIVVRSLDNSVYQHFAIHLEADKADIPREEIEDNYAELEYWVLKSFNDFVKRHRDKLWVHWDMKNVHFGFEAIKHRFNKLVEGSKEKFEEIPSNNKFNLDYMLESMYGEGYVENPDKLLSLVKVNNGGIADRKYLSLDLEDSECEKKNFNSVLNSLDYKVDFICSSIKKLKARNLKVQNTNFYAIFGDAVNAPWFTFLGWLLGIILSVMSLYGITLGGK